MSEARRPGPILVTAFEPFGPPGKPVRPENASEVVLRAFLRGSRTPVDAVVLPVNPRAEVQLARALHGDPAGVVALGEAGGEGGWDTNVEVVARDLPVAAGRAPTGGDAPLLSSPFAPAIPLLPGMERKDRIGSYWCNRAYWRVLEWCLRFERPAVFLHLRVDGDRDRQRSHLEHVLSVMGTHLRSSLVCG